MGFQDLIAGALEIEADEVGDVLFVLNNQNAMHCGNKLAGGVSAREPTACDEIVT
jgi:hypothetical protein